MLPWSRESSDHQQIDVLAVGEDAIFVVECKAAESTRNANFKKDIDHIEQTKEGIVKSLKELSFLPLEIIGFRKQAKISADSRLKKYTTSMKMPITMLKI